METKTRSEKVLYTAAEVAQAGAVIDSLKSAIKAELDYINSSTFEHTLTFSEFSEKVKEVLSNLELLLKNYKVVNSPEDAARARVKIIFCKDILISNDSQEQKEMVDGDTITGFVQDMKDSA